MAEGINVRLPKPLHDFVQRKCDAEMGRFSSASEYIRDLIRHDFDREERARWEALKSELAAGMAADESEFVVRDADEVIEEAKRGRSNSPPTSHGR